MFDVLSAEPRREIIRSLLDESQHCRLPLPEAAGSPNQSIDSETLVIELRHQHLPKLADLGYIRWENDAFRVQQGPNFEEPAFIMRMLINSADQIPESLIADCKILQEMV